MIRLLAIALLIASPSVLARRTSQVPLFPPFRAFQGAVFFVQGTVFNPSTTPQTLRLTLTLSGAASTAFAQSRDLARFLNLFGKFYVGSYYFRNCDKGSRRCVTDTPYETIAPGEAISFLTTIMYNGDWLSHVQTSGTSSMNTGAILTAEVSEDQGFLVGTVISGVAYDSQSLSVTGNNMITSIPFNDGRPF